jgi:hypothetical protein
MHYVWDQLACCETCTGCRPFGLSAWIVVFAAAQLVLTQARRPARGRARAAAGGRVAPDCSSRLQHALPGNGRTRLAAGPVRPRAAGGAVPTRAARARSAPTSTR